MRLAEFDHEVRGPVLYAKIRGDIDMSNAGDLLDGMIALIQNQSLGVVLDLSAVDYIDSAGIQLLYRLRDGLRSRGQKLRLVIPPGSPVNDTLRLSGMDHGSEIVETVESAGLAFEPS